MTIDVYTDGSTKDNGTDDAVGGWAYLIMAPGAAGNFIIERAEQVFGTTNNRMELVAIIKALEKIKSSPLLHIFDYSKINIFTDSAYVYNCYIQKWYMNWQKNGWKNAKKEPVKNKELWEQLIPYFEDNHFSFYKVKGHSGNEYNEIVDSLAQNAAIGHFTDMAYFDVEEK